MFVNDTIVITATLYNNSMLVNLLLYILGVQVPALYQYQNIVISEMGSDQATF